MGSERQEIICRKACVQEKKDQHRALNEGKVGASCAFEGYSNSELFEAYVEKVLAPTLKPGQTVILDNASFHKSVKTRNLIEKAFCNGIIVTTAFMTHARYDIFYTQ